MPSKLNNLLGIFITEEISDAAASLTATPAKIPLEIDGIQINFCKNPTCANHGVPPGLKKGAHRSKAAASATGNRSNGDCAGRHRQWQPARQRICQGSLAGRSDRSTSYELRGQVKFDKEL